MDFYKQRRFICEITGHSGLTFFEALRSEVRAGSPGLSVSPLLHAKENPSQMDESREVNSAFPEALKEPILRRIQFSTVSRVDNLGRFYCILFGGIFPADIFFFQTVDEIYEVSSGHSDSGCSTRRSAKHKARNSNRTFIPVNPS